jgi:hypothetical protein
MPDETSRSKLSDEVLESVRKSEQALLEAGRKFAEAVADAVPGAPEAARKIVDQAFSLTDRILTTQREFARAVLESLPGHHDGGASGDGETKSGDTSSSSSA